MFRIEPFNDFWINCLFNSYISVLRSVDDSYHILSYCNEYHYGFKKEGKANDYLANSVTVGTDFSSYLNEIFEEHSIVFQENIKESIITHIEGSKKNNHILFLGVDLFYWIPNSISWQKNHWYHFAIITNYDHETDELIVLDDDLTGFKEFRIPMERAIKAFQSFRGKVEYRKDDAYYLVQKSFDVKFEISKENIVNNAYDLIENLDFILSKAYECWVIPHNENDYLKENISLFSMRCFSFQNRQKGNRIFFDKLFGMGYLSQKQRDFLEEHSGNIMDNWEKQKNIFIRMMLKSSPEYSDKEFIDFSSRQFQSEKELWKTFISYLDR